MVLKKPSQNPTFDKLNPSPDLNVCDENVPVQRSRMNSKSQQIDFSVMVQKVNLFPLSMTKYPYLPLLHWSYPGDLDPEVSVDVPFLSLSLTPTLTFSFKNPPSSPRNYLFLDHI